MEFLTNHALEIVGFVTGLIYLYLEWKASIYLWIASIIMPAISLIVYFDAGLYADFGINIYYLLIAIYGWFAWKYGGKKDQQAKAAENKQEEGAPIIHTPNNQILPLLIVSAVLWAGIWWLLVTFTPSTVPVADAFTTALSIVAYWMLARKQVEQWLVWLVVDAVCTVLYVYKGIPFYAVLYGFYTVIAWFGYFKWLRMMKEQNINQ
jgi:nicotinamide mononucleotide transporter